MYIVYVDVYVWSTIKCVHPLPAPLPECTLTKAFALKMAKAAMTGELVFMDSDTNQEILTALNTVQSYPDVQEKIKEFQTWITKNSKSLASNDLLKLMSIREGQPVDVSRTRQLWTRLEHGVRK